MYLLDSNDVIRRNRMHMRCNGNGVDVDRNLAVTSTLSITISRGDARLIEKSECLPTEHCIEFATLSMMVTAAISSVVEPSRWTDISVEQVE